MATELGKAYVQIVPSARGISGSMTTALAPAAATAGTKAGTTVSKNMGQRISAVGKSFIAGGAIATAISAPIIRGIKDSLAAYEQQETAETKLEEIYKSRMGVSKKAAQATMEVASALQKEGVIGDEVTLSGAQQLATFAKYPGTVDTLLPAMDNLLAQQKGVNATSEDAVNIGNLMGKVMQGQTGALKRVGVSFTDAQEKVLKYGTEEEKAAMLAEVINDNVGNMNKALADTPAGKMKQLSNSLGDIKEGIGAALAPVMADLAKWVSETFVPAFEKLVGFLQKHPIFTKILLAITGILAVGGPIMMLLGSIMMVAPAIGAAFSALMGPIGLVIAAIAAAVAIGIALYKNWDTVKAWLVTIWEGIKSAAETVWEAIKQFFIGWLTFYLNIYKTIFNAIKTVVLTVWNAIKTAATTVWNGIKTAIINPIKAAWTWLTTTFNNIKIMMRKKMMEIKMYTAMIWQRIKDAITAPIRKVREWLSAAWSAIRERAKNGFQRIKDAIVAPIEKARDLIKGIIDKIKSFFSFDFKLPNIKLPHIYVDPRGWNIGDIFDGVIPSLGIDWYAKGGIMKRPTLFGGGEAGSEAIVPLDPFWNRMDNMADSIVNGFASISAAGAGGHGDIHLDVYMYPNGPKMMEETVKMYDKGKKILG